MNIVDLENTYTDMFTGEIKLRDDTNKKDIETADDFDIFQFVNKLWEDLV